VLAVVLAWRGIEHLNARSAAHPAFVVDPWHCLVRSAPSWLSPDDLESIRRDSGLLAERHSLFSPGLPERYARAYERSAWVRRAVIALLRYPNRLEVHLEIREPVAAVRTEAGLVLIDEEGVRLPGVRQSLPGGGRPIRRIVGVESAPPEPGRVWRGAAREGAVVARTLLDLPLDLAREVPVVEIDVGNARGRVDPARSEILLVTECGTVIEWGRSHASPRAALEPRAQMKFEKLRKALQVYPRLAGLSRLKLQFDDIVVEEKDGPGHASGD
jgi:hypothetical protein